MEGGVGNFSGPDLGGSFAVQREPQIVETRIDPEVARKTAEEKRVAQMRKAIRNAITLAPTPDNLPRIG